MTAPPAPLKASESEPKGSAGLGKPSRLKTPSADTDVSALHRLARHYMRRERSGHSLQPTALVNEAYMRLADYTRVQWQDRAHFFAVAAQVMRRLLVATRGGTTSSVAAASLVR